MASKRDLVEAHSYNRRRLVTAFVSGAPGGREVEPSRPGKAVFSGVVLAALVVGAGALAGEIEPTVKDGWNENSLVISKETGARYVALGKTLYPVLNTASARLAIPAEEYKVVVVPQDRINASKIGLGFGLPDAPDEIPAAADLIQTGWTSCVRAPHEETQVVNGTEQKVAVPVGTSMLLRNGAPTTTPVLPSQALVVQAGAQKSIVTDNAAYPTDDRALSVLGLAAVEILKVTPQWVAQFTAGDALRPLAAASGRAPLTPASGLGGYSDGDVLRLQGTQTRFLATEAGAFALSPVRAALYLEANKGREKEIKAAPAKLAPGVLPAALKDTATWPEAVPKAVEAKGGVACAVLDATPGQAPTTRLEMPIEGEYLKTRPGGAIVVAPGGGALVRTTASGPVYLIDGLGRLFRLAGNGEQVSFGFGQQPIPLVTPGFLAMFGHEVLIDRNQLTNRAA